MAAKRVRAPRPVGDVEQIRQRGGDALALAVEFRSVLERRFPGNFIDQLTTDVLSIEGVVPGAIVARGEKTAATGSERARAKVLADHVGSIRENIKQAFLGNKDVLKGWGVGAKVSSDVTKSVVAAANLILRRATDHHDEVSAAGIVDEDLALLSSQVSGLQGADSDQGTKIRESSGATSTRDATLVRVENATQIVGLRGKQEFLAQAALRARFEKLLAPYGKTKKTPKSKAGGVSAAAAAPSGA